MIFHSTLFRLLYLLPCCAFVTTTSTNDVGNGSGNGGNTEADDDFFPPLIDSDDIAFFFSTYDLDGLHWALTNIFHRSARYPNSSKGKELPQTLVARGGGDTYTTEYKLKHDLEQARYLVEQLAISDPETSKYFKSQVIPIYEQILSNIPPLSELTRTKGLYAFTKDDYAAGIGKVYNKALFLATSDELDPSWRSQESILNSLDWDLYQQNWFGVCGEDPSDLSDASTKNPTLSSTSGVIIIDDILTPKALSIIRQLLLRNTHWFQTKTPLEFGKYVGSYIDDGLNDPIFLQLAKELHQSMPRIMKDHPLKYMWAYKYDSEWESGINLHADQAAVNVNIWLSSDGANLEEEGYGGGLVVFTAKPKEDWEFETYNTNTDFIVDELLRPTNFANITVPHKPNRAVIFDSALFHQTEKYRFNAGYDLGRINLTLLFGDMQKGGDGSCSPASSNDKVKADQ